MVNDTLTLRWSTVPGHRYQVEYKNQLSDAAWLQLGPVVNATGATASASDSPLIQQRFFRLRLLD
jgi:hypothetical protein